MRLDGCRSGPGPTPSGRRAGGVAARAGVGPAVEPGIGRRHPTTYRPHRQTGPTARRDPWSRRSPGRFWPRACPASPRPGAVPAILRCKSWDASESVGSHVGQLVVADTRRRSRGHRARCDCCAEAAKGLARAKRAQVSAGTTRRGSDRIPAVVAGEPRGICAEALAAPRRGCQRGDPGRSLRPHPGP